MTAFRTRTRARALLAAALLASPALPGAGCGGARGDPPNPELKVPDVPPGRVAGGGAAPKAAKSVRRG